MAEEKKLSKIAQAREDAKNRRHFKEKCYEIKGKISFIISIERFSS